MQGQSIFIKKKNLPHFIGYVLALLQVQNALKGLYHQWIRSLYTRSVSLTIVDKQQ